MEAKLDSLLQLLQNSEARMSQEMQSIKLAIDAIGLAARTPTRCSTDGPSRDASELRSPSDPATAAVAPTATVVVPELAATAAIDAALDGDATSSAASTPDTCSTDGLHRGTCEDSSVEVSMLSETTQPWQSSFVLEFDIMAPTRCLKHIPKEVTFELMAATMACSVLSPSPAINESDSVSPYAESPCWRPLLPAPLPKPPWLLLVHEPVAGHVLPTLVFAGALHGFKGETATSVMTRGFQMGVVSADFQGWLLLVGNIWEWSRLLESVNLHGCTVMFVEQRSWNYMLAQVELKLWSSWRSYSMVKLSILLDSTRSVRWLISPWDLGEKKIKSNKHGSLLELQEVTLFPSTRSKNAEVQSATKLMYTSVQWQFLKKEESKVNRNLAVQLAAETFLLCNDAEEDLAHILSDKLLQHDKFWWQPCYPPFVRVDHNQMEHVLAKAIAVDQVQSGSCSIGYVTQGSVLALYICKTQIRCTFSLQQVHDRVKLFAQTVRDSLCKWNCTGYQGCSVNCCLLWASEREKLLFYSAYEQVHCRLQSKTAEMHQHITQPGKNLLLFLQPKPPWLSILTQVYAVIEEREVYTHGEVMTLNSKIIFAAPEPYVRQLIGDCLLRTLYQKEWYSSSIMLLSEAKLQDDTGGILIDHHNGLSLGILGVLVTWSPYKLFSICEARTVQRYRKFTRYNHCPEETNFKVELLLYPVVTSTTPDAFHGGVCNDIRLRRSSGSGELFQCMASYLLGDNNTFGSHILSTSGHSQISKVDFPVATTIIFWVPVVLVDNPIPHDWSLWDPGGCMLAWYSYEKWGTTSEHTPLHFSDQLRWSSMLLAYMHVGSGWYHGLVMT